MTLKHTLSIILVISIIGMILSLYMWYYGDPIANILTGSLRDTSNALIPCTLCRYARIALYPIVMISWAWLLYHDHHSVKYIVWLSLVGVIITSYQRALQSWVISESAVCIVGSKSCAIIDWQYYGFTIPMLAWVAFMIILWVSIRYLYSHKRYYEI